MRISDPFGRRRQPWEKGYRSPQEIRALWRRLVLLGLLALVLIALGYVLS